MKLSNRISLFFLVAMAVVLAGFSCSIYWLVRSHLYSQFEVRLDGALETLTAAIESGPSGLEWEVSERNINLGMIENSPLVWSVFDVHGVRIDGSAQGAPLLEQTSKHENDSQRFTKDIRWNNESWRVSHYVVGAETFHPSAAGDSPPPTEESGVKHYATLTLAVGSPLSRVISELRAIGVILVGSSVSIWLIAALVGRWMCRKALAPLTQIADTMSTISVADLDARLPPANSGDELEELSVAFNELLDRLQISFERQRRFASDASHQLRTPLTALLGQVEVALRRERSVDEYQHTLCSVEVQAKNLHKIIEMLLALTRESIDIGDSDLECFELNGWLREHVGSWQQHPRACDLRVDADCKHQLWVTARSGLLGQVVDNLWENACKYSSPKTPITIRTVLGADDVKLVIEDDGFGIAEHEVPRVADPFYRSDDARSRGIGGTGLGLAIVKRIVDAIGAKLEIKSALGKGSVFTIVFPAVCH